MINLLAKLFESVYHAISSNGDRKYIQQPEHKLKINLSHCRLLHDVVLDDDDDGDGSFLEWGDSLKYEEQKNNSSP